MIAARKAARVEQTAVSEIYADLGSYPTEMAQGHMTEIRSLLDDNDVVLAIVPEVKTGGGIPTLQSRPRAVRRNRSATIMNAKAFPCIPKGAISVSSRSVINSLTFSCE